MQRKIEQAKQAVYVVQHEGKLYVCIEEPLGAALLFNSENIQVIGVYVHEEDNRIYQFEPDYCRKQLQKEGYVEVIPFLRADWSEEKQEFMYTTIMERLEEHANKH